MSTRGAVTPLFLGCCTFHLENPFFLLGWYNNTKLKDEYVPRVFETTWKTVIRISWPSVDSSGIILSRISPPEIVVKALDEDPLSNKLVGFASTFRKENDPLVIYSLTPPPHLSPPARLSVRLEGELVQEQPQTTAAGTARGEDSLRPDAFLTRNVHFRRVQTVMSDERKPTVSDFCPRVDPPTPRAHPVSVS